MKSSPGIDFILKFFIISVKVQLLRIALNIHAIFFIKSIPGFDFFGLITLGYWQNWFQSYNILFFVYLISSEFDKASPFIVESNAATKSLNDVSVEPSSTSGWARFKRTERMACVAQALLMTWEKSKNVEKWRKFLMSCTVCMLEKVFFIFKKV